MVSNECSVQNPVDEFVDHLVHLFGPISGVDLHREFFDAIYIRVIAMFENPFHLLVIHLTHP